MRLLSPQTKLSRGLGSESPEARFCFGKTGADISLYINCRTQTVLRVQSMSSVITIRIDRETKKKIKKHRINVSETVRKALQREISKREEEDLERALDEAGRILRKIPENDIVKLIRDSRDER